MTTPTHKDSEIWVTARQICKALGVCREAFNRETRVLIPTEASRRAAGRRALEYEFGAVLRAVAQTGLGMQEQRRAHDKAARRADAAAEVRAMPDGELLLGDGGEALERLRHWKAKLAEDEYHARRGALIERDAVVAALNLAFGGIRNLLWRWDRRHRESEAQELRDAVQRGMDALGRLGVEATEEANDGQAD